MYWILIPIVAAVIATIFLTKAAGLVSPEQAVDFLKNGAIVIDVRTAGEFRAGHLDGAINIPLTEIETSVPKHISDNSQVLLLHCLSGSRSAAAERQLRAMGYANTFNLGSYRRAAMLLKRAASETPNRTL